MYDATGHGQERADRLIDRLTDRRMCNELNLDVVGSTTNLSRRICAV
jgi:hypothetical protein